jgi:hypothetical protein
LISSVAVRLYVLAALDLIVKGKSEQMTQPLGLLPSVYPYYHLILGMKRFDGEELLSSFEAGIGHPS